MGYMTIRDEMADLQRRVERLESRLGAAAPDRAPPLTAAAAAPPTTPVPPRNAPPAAPAIAPPPLPSRSSSGETAPSAGASGPRVPRRSSISLEQFIGARGFAVLGGLGMLIGIGLFLSYAVQQGWVVLSDGAKCMVGGVVSAGLLLTGEFLRRRIPGVAASALSAVGLCGMYASVQAAFGLYNLVAPETAIAMLLAICLLGVGVSWLARSPGLAVLAQIGAYLVPLLVQTSAPPPWSLPLYLVILLVGGLALPMLLGRSFRILRPIASVATALYAPIWAFGANGVSFPVIACLFFASCWAIIHTELVHATVRGVGVGVAPALKRLGGVGDVAFHSALATFWAVGLAIVVLSDQAPDADWVPALLGFLATVSIASMLSPGLGFGARAPESNRERMAAVLLLQGAALLVVTIALALTSWLQVTAWLALGLASYIGGRRIEAIGMRVFGLVLLGIGTFQIVVIEQVLYLDAAAILPAPGLHITGLALLFTLGSAAWAVTSIASPRPSSDRVGVAHVAAALASLMVLLAPLHPESEAGSLTFAWAATAAALAGLTRLAPRHRMDIWASVGLGGAALAWMLAHVVDWGVWGGAPGLHPGLLGAGVLAALAWALPRWVFDVDLRRRWLPGLSAGALCVVLLATSLEIARGAGQLAESRAAEFGALSLWWGVFGVGLIAAGFAWRIKPSRYAGLALVGVAAAKVVLIDSSEVSPGWRIAGFFGVGMLMVVVALGYGAIARLVDEERAALDESADDAD